jgi:hypothetical protein
MTFLNNWADIKTPVIGMLHLPSLPGSPLHKHSLNEIRSTMLTDAAALKEGGVHGLMIENFGDVPFFPGRVPAHTVSQITAIAADVKRECDLPLGINVLRNDGLSALAIAHAVGADYIRVNVLSGARVTDQGVMQGIAHDLLRYKAELKSDIKIMADVNVKHSAPLGPYPFEDEVEDLIDRALADAVIVSGTGTGKAVDKDELKRVRKIAPSFPIFLGSGVSAENAASFLPEATGFIVGTSLKVDGIAANLVDVSRVKALINAIG